MAISAAVDLGLEHVVIDQRHAEYDSLSVRIGPDGVEGELTVAGSHIPLTNVNAIYARPLEPIVARGRDAQVRVSTNHCIFLEWLDVANCLVVSRPSAMTSN